MKRGPGHHYEGGGPGGMPQKRPRGDKFETRILVPSKVAGSIIGKGGSNIQRLRSGCSNVRIPDCPGPERIMTITSDDTETAVKVLEQSLPFMTEEAVRGGPGAVAGSDSQIEVRLLIHQSIVGGIIGRAGFKIKEIREASGAGVKVYQNCAPQSTDRCVAVQGNAEKIALACGEIFQVVNMTEIKGPDEPYDPINFDAFYANEYGGFGSEMDLGFGGAGVAPMGGVGEVRGRGGGGGMGGGRGRGGFPPRGGRDDAGGRPFGGSDGGGFRPSRGGFGGQPEFGPPRGGRGGGFGGVRGGGGGGRGRSFDGPPGGFGYEGEQIGAFGGGEPNGAFGFGDDDGGEQESVQVTIPKDMAGAIIGPGGSRIRKIRNDSKATIAIAEAGVNVGSNERIITITGNQKQIQTAQYLLQQSVRENVPAAGGMGGMGQAGGHYGY